MSSPTASSDGLLYLDDTYLGSCRACVTSVDSAECLVFLDRTVFHPQGGGQPSDTGELELQLQRKPAAEEEEDEKEPLVFSVDKVVRLPDGRVAHHISSSTQQQQQQQQQQQHQRLPAEGDEVEARIDMERRVLHARLHSAGHLLDAAVRATGEYALEPGKGHHFPSGPYVEYVGELAAQTDANAFGERVEAELKRLIQADELVQVSMVDGHREVAMGGVACGCGGTHVRRTGEIGAVRVKKVKVKGKKRVVQVKYELCS